MSEVRPVLAETPQKRQAFVDPKTGVLTDYGHHVMRAFFERTGGFTDDVWVSLGLGFQSIANQGRTDQRLQSIEGQLSGLVGDIGGLRGDPRLQTADRADATAKDALAVALSRAPPDLLRRVEEVERGLSVVLGALGELRAQTRMAQRAQAQEIEDISIRSSFEQGLVARQGIESQRRLAQAEQDIDTLDSTLESRARDALSGIAPVEYNAPLGEFSLNATLTSLGGLSPVADQFAYATGADTWALATVTSFGRSLLDDADATAGRTTLGLGSLATLSTINNSNWSGAALSIANGGTGATTASAARTALGLAIGTDVLAYVAPSPGWSAATGTATRTTFDTATVTLPQLAERVKAIIDDNLAANRFGA